VTTPDRRPLAIGGLRRLAPATALLLAFAAGPAEGADPAAMARLVERWAPAVVSIEAVLEAEVRMGGEAREEEARVRFVGAVVDPSGLIMILNSRISSNRLTEMLALAGGGHGGGEGGLGVTVTPVSFLVTFAGSDERRAAFLAATDSQLDLAFLQLEEPPAEPLPAVDLAAAGTPALGQEVYVVSRLNPAFDRAPYYSSVEVVGEVTHPRRAWVLQGDLSALGLPAFDAAGRPVGVLSTVVSSLAAEPRGGVPGLGNFLGEADKTTGPLAVLLLPAPPVARAVALSKERAAALAAERRAAREEGREEGTPY
jgi:hypothetical protein